MPAITLDTIVAGDLDFKHLADLTTSAELTATDRLGNEKKTWAGLVDQFDTMQGTKEDAWDAAQAGKVDAWDAAKDAFDADAAALLDSLSADAAVTETGVNRQAAQDAAAAALVSQTAAEAAIVNVTAAAGKVLFTTQALGHAGSADGQTFAVTQAPTGEGVDTFLHNGAVDVWQNAGAVGELAVAEIVARQTKGVYLPVASMLSWQTLVQNGRGALNSARPKSRVFGRNMIAYVHNPRSQTDLTAVTPGYADGPSVAGTATRFLQTTLAQLFTLWTNAYRPPAGTYTVEFWLKSTGGGALNARSGNATQGYTVRAVTGAWTKFQHQFTTTGADWSSFVITGDGVTLADFLIGEVRMYQLVAADVPLIAADPPGDDFMPTLAFAKVRHLGRLLDNTAATAEGAGLLRIQGYPTVKVFSEITLLFVGALITAATSQQMITTDTTTALGTTNTTLAITSGQADGAPDYSGITSFFDYEMTGQGAVAVALAVKNNDRRGYVDALEMGSAATAFAGFSARAFRVGANSSTEVGYASTFRYQGLIGAAKVFDRYLTGDEILIEVAKVKAELAAAGIVLAQIPAAICAMGDSQTASSTGSRGPSWAYQQADAGTYGTINMPVRVLAVGGTTTQDLVRDQLPVALNFVRLAVKAGIRPIVTIFTATNNQQEIVDDWVGGDAALMFNNLAGWWQYTRANVIAPLVAAGAKVVFATPLPDGGTPPANWEPARSALRLRQIADYVGSTTVFIQDFGGTAGISTVGDTAGANFDTDHRHLLTAGHTIAKPVTAAAVNLALDAP